MLGCKRAITIDWVIQHHKIARVSQLNMKVTPVEGNLKETMV